jgi:peptidoglycan/LPS O-acetylase OafA/YrhL
VCGFHLTYWRTVEGTAGAPQDATSFPELARFFKSGWVGVQIFFVISGFVIAYTAQAKSAGDFLRSRFLRLFPAALLCATITVTFALSFGLCEPDYALRAYIASIFFYPFGPWVDGSYWSLGVEVSFYALVWLLIRTGRLSHFETAVCAIGIISLLTTLLCWWHPFDLYSSRIFVLLLLRHGSYFALGATLWLMVFRGDTLLRRILFVLYFWGALTEISLSGGARGDVVVPCLLFSLSTAWLVAAVKFNVLTWNAAPVTVRSAARIAGLTTYPLYLLHNVVGAILIHIFASAGLPDLLALALSIASVGIAALIIALIAEPQIRTMIGAYMERGAVGTEAG